MGDENGDTVFTHAAGEVSKIRKCKKTVVKIRKGDEKCCQELPVWTGEKFEKEAYMKPINRQVTSVCTPRVCSVHNSPIFEIGTEDEEVWVKVEEKEIILTKKPKELKLNSHSKEEEMRMRDGRRKKEERWKKEGRRDE